MNPLPAALLALALGVCLPAYATPTRSTPTTSIPSTSTGAISIAQVVDLIQRAPNDNAARNAATAYLAGVGEATGVLVAEAGRRAAIGLTCARPLGMSSAAALAALSRIDKGRWSQTAATPILVDDMLGRAGCH
ncbi:hypothetical protein [Ancylobacter sp. IITR112]|uniref:hypothetical protein n=1 Tax=Ancylobacter sp. IITR112 TaxID=3138073 RepID=UPI00352A0056